jgi:hypothetical protein
VTFHKFPRTNSGQVSSRARVVLVTGVGNRQKPTFNFVIINLVPGGRTWDCSKTAAPTNPITWVHMDQSANFRFQDVIVPRQQHLRTQSHGSIWTRVQFPVPTILFDRQRSTYHKTCIKYQVLLSISSMLVSKLCREEVY